MPRIPAGGAVSGKYWPVIGQHWSRDLNTKLWLVQCRERKSGLDITCENVETGQLETVTENMKKYKQRQDFTVTMRL